MKRHAGLWAAIALVLAVAGWVGWRLVAHMRARMNPGATLVLTVDASHPFVAGVAPAEARRRTLEVMRERLDKLAPLALFAADGDRVTIQLARSDDAAHVARLLARSGRLEFKIVDDGSEYMKGLSGFVVANHAELVDVEIGRDGWTERDSGAPHSDVYLRAPARDKLAGAFRDAAATKPLPSDHIVAFERKPTSDGKYAWRSYYLFARNEVDGDRISDVEVSWDQQTGRPEVSLTFDADGAKAFEAATARAVGKKLAIVLEGTVQSAPVIESKIAGGRARITVGDSDPLAMQEEAKDLIAVLKVGSLAAPVTLVATRAPKP
ncbi:MAG TPA: hypothetical protein VGL86_32555 [Polyangia bacterium]